MYKLCIDSKSSEAKWQPSNRFAVASPFPFKRDRADRYNMRYRQKRVSDMTEWGQVTNIRSFRKITHVGKKRELTCTADFNIGLKT